jgi:hypothetical protein
MAFSAMQYGAPIVQRMQGAVCPSAHPEVCKQTIHEGFALKLPAKDFIPCNPLFLIAFGKG